VQDEENKENIIIMIIIIQMKYIKENKHKSRNENGLLDP